MIKAFFAFAIGFTAAGQTFDNSGNGMLNGTYYFRQVFWAVDTSQTGSLGTAFSIYGNITFDGNGNYNVNGMVFDSALNTLPQPYTPTGTYKISASGYGLISSPANSHVTLLSGAASTDDTYGLVSSTGIFVGSSTENQQGYNDLLIAAPLSSTSPPTLATFSGSYAVAVLDSPDGTPADTAGTLLAMNPNGSGNLGTITLSSQIPSAGNLQQSIGGVKYILSNGAYNVQFPTSQSNVISGNHYFYISPDGNFVFGGSPTGWDMLVGVRASPTAAPTVGGLYYQAGLYQDESQLANAGYADLDSYFGSLYANSGVILQHERALSAFFSVADLNFSDGYTSTAAGTTDSTTSEKYYYSTDGTVRVGWGQYPSLGISVALQAPTFTPTSSVYITPTGIQNAASSALFTSGIAPGELITISGTNLAPDPLVVDGNLPTNLDGIQVMINGIAAPIYYASSRSVSVMVPYETGNSGSFVAAIQVINNGVPSNTVTVFTSLTAPGVFTSPAGGLGYAIAQHSTDYSLVSPSNPAVAGETILVYLTGLGAVTPAVADGSVGPSTVPLSQATSAITAKIGGVSATQIFAGLAPAEPASIYAMDITIPTGLTAGDNILAIAGPDSVSSEALITIGSGTTASERPEASKPAARPHPSRQSAATRRVFPSRFLLSPER